MLYISPSILLSPTTCLTLSAYTDIKDLIGIKSDMSVEIEGLLSQTIDRLGGHNGNSYFKYSIALASTNSDRSLEALHLL
jgi:hypothetical protein